MYANADDEICLDVHMREFNCDCNAFSFVTVVCNGQVRECISALPQKKWVFTNCNEKHARLALKSLNLLVSANWQLVRVTRASWQSELNCKRYLLA